MFLREIKNAKMPIVQVVRTFYSPEKKRAVERSVGRFRIADPVPEELLAELDNEEREKLMAWLEKRRKRLDLDGLNQFATELPEKLEDLGESWADLLERADPDEVARLEKVLADVWAAAEACVKAGREAADKARAS